jgi:predicted Zn-dependent peptidase
LLISCGSQTESNSSRYKYETVEDDPLGTKIYTLDNGLKIFISENKAEPRVVAQVAVRTGSKQDPADATGLAHYLEHMLFKGTSQIGTKDWEVEKQLLQQISDLYESHRNTDDVETRKKIYAQIDSISGVAAKLAIANEYDKMVSSLGAQGTNAYTWYEQTVYINDIPANELEKWAALESHRFSELVLRLFHTELEAVYEEFNRSQDSDGRQAFYTLMSSLFENHPYGTQTTIGTSEHLKNPSMEKIHAYFKDRYKPNNMAIVLSGDVNPDEAVAIIDKYFGGLEKGELSKFEFTPEEPIEKPIIKEVTGVQPEFVNIGFRLPGAGTDEALKLRVLDGILSNGQAGLIDLNLMQKQKVLRAYSQPSIYKDYSVFTLTGNPREGQSLEKVAELLLEQLALVKKGEFEDWMVEAVVNDFKLTDLRRSESNWSRAGQLVDAFVFHREWADVVKDYDAMNKLTKQDIIDFTNEWFGDNYVQVNKRRGENKAVKVEKPTITPVEIDRDSKSDFYASWDSIESGRLNPVFLDYDNLIKRDSFKGKVEFSSIKNENNELFDLYYILDMGSYNDLVTSLAIEYLPYLGTKELSAEELQKELFRLGISFDVFSSSDRSYVVLSGLSENLEAGIRLFEDVLANVEADPEAYLDMVEGTLKKRQDAMQSKGQILFRAMSDYAKYGDDSPMKHMLSEEELRSIEPTELVDRIKNLTSFEHKIFYYGPQESDEVISVLDKYHKLPEAFTPIPPAKEFKELDIDKNKVYFTNYDMVQSEMLMISKGRSFDPEMAPQIQLFNEYFGSGLSSIVFQEIRESKALAYSAFSSYTMPSKESESHYVRAYVGAQVDKLPEATNAMLELMNDMPRSDIQFEAARDAAMKKIETNRTTGASIFFSYQSALDRGLDYDLNKVIYDSLKTMKFETLEDFFNENIKGNNYTYSVIGNEDLVDKETLKQLGEVEILDLETLFGYPEVKEPEALVKN